MAERFVFGIALAGRAQVRDWAVVEALLDLTLRTVAAQTDGDCEVIVAGHDRPAALGDDPRHRFIRADWPALPPDTANNDGGRKKVLIREDVLARGGGLLMHLDADDWVDRRLVEVSRAAIGPDAVGGIVESGWAVDVGAGVALRLPDAEACALPFNRVCGSCTVGRLDPAAEGVRRDPYPVFHSHHVWPEEAERHGVALARLPVEGAYIIGTGENHSERHGPFGAWRRAVSAGVRERGVPLGGADLARFGLTAADLAAAARVVGGVGFRSQVG